MHPTRQVETERLVSGVRPEHDRRTTGDDPRETALLERLRRGEPGALTELLRRDGPSMLALSRRILNQESAARDAVLEAFVSASHSSADLRDGTRPSAWLRRLTVAAALARLGSAPSDRAASPDPRPLAFDPTGHHAHPVARWRATPEPGKSRPALRAFVRSKIDRLPNDSRIVLILCDLSGSTPSEAAALLGIANDEVTTRLGDARRLLMAQLEPLLLDEGRTGVVEAAH